MALNFPAAPAEGDVYSAEGVTYQWVTNRWVKTSSVQLDPVTIVEDDVSNSEKGYFVAGDLMICYGQVTTGESSGSGTTTFAQAFETVPRVITNIFEPSSATASDTRTSTHEDPTTSQVTVHARRVGSGGPEIPFALTVRYIAVGEAPDALKKPKSIGVVGGDGSDFLPITGGTLTGNLTIGDATTNASMVLDRDVSSYTQIQYADSGIPRWNIARNNSDNDLRFNRYDVAGTYIDAPFIVKDGGGVAIANGLEVIGGSVAALSSIFVDAQNSTSNAHYWMRDDQQRNRGVIYFNQSADGVTVARRDTSDATTNEMTMAATQTSFNQNVYIPRLLGPEANSGARMQSYAGGNNYSFAWSSPNGLMAIDGGAASFVIGTNSDYRVKNVVGELDGALTVVNKLRPVEYTIKELKGKLAGLNKDPEAETPIGNVPIDTHVGLIAHEVQEHVPSAVLGIKDDPEHLQSVTYQLLVPHLIKAIQELTARVEALENP